MGLIISETNTKVKYVMRLQSDRRFRWEEKAFVVEGSRWIQELIAHGIRPMQLFHTAEWSERFLLERFDLPSTEVNSAVMSRMSDVETSPGVLAVVPMISRLIPANADQLLILDAIQNPGNLGTLLRTATAVAMNGVILAPGCVDLYNPKVVRASMGALLNLPIVSADWESIADRYAHLDIWVSELTPPARRYTEIDWRRPYALIVGNEAQGVGEAATRLGKRVVIPMATDTESLNAAMAGAILLFEAARQRGFNFATSE